jgi:hypothetical protein
MTTEGWRGSCWGGETSEEGGQGGRDNRWRGKGTGKSEREIGKRVTTLVWSGGKGGHG